MIGWQILAGVLAILLATAFVCIGDQARQIVALKKLRANNGTGVETFTVKLEVDSSQAMAAIAAIELAAKAAASSIEQLRGCTAAQP